MDLSFPFSFNYLPKQNHICTRLHTKYSTNNVPLLDATNTFTMVIISSVTSLSIPWKVKIYTLLKLFRTFIEQLLYTLRKRCRECLVKSHPCIYIRLMNSKLSQLRSQIQHVNLKILYELHVVSYEIKQQMQNKLDFHSLAEKKIKHPPHISSSTNQNRQISITVLYFRNIRFYAINIPVFPSLSVHSIGYHFLHNLILHIC